MKAKRRHRLKQVNALLGVVERRRQRLDNAPVKQQDGLLVACVTFSTLDRAAFEGGKISCSASPVSDSISVARTLQSRCNPSWAWRHNWSRHPRV